jgi:hypothetical protein
LTVSVASLLVPLALALIFIVFVLLTLKVLTGVSALHPRLLEAKPVPRAQPYLQRQDERNFNHARIHLVLRSISHSFLMWQSARLTGQPCRA